MRLSVVAAAILAAAIPAAPTLAHCRTVHHRVHRVAWHASRRHHVVRYAACGCRIRHHRYRRAVYETVYRPAPEVEVTYERPLYRPYPVVYEEPLYRPYPVFYGRRFHRGFHGGHRFGVMYGHRDFMHGRRGWGRHWR
jgi:hypothetical protein